MAEANPNHGSLRHVVSWMLRLGLRTIQSVNAIRAAVRELRLTRDQ
jgi:hypothetical protein